MARNLMMTMALLACGLAATAARAETVEDPGEIEAVTVFRGQAMVTRMIQTPKAAGLHELVVTDLPSAVQPGSIYAESANGVEVRSVRYRVRPVSKDVREEVRVLDEQIQGLQDEVNKFQSKVQLHQQHRSYLDKLEKFIAPTANVELSKGVLNSKTLQEMTEMLFSQREQLMEADLELNLKKRDLAEQLSLLQRKRSTITGSSSKVVREAVVFVNLKAAGGSQVRLRYLVNNATWYPSYNVRGSGDRKTVTVEYLASVRQTSGENWDDVAMTLSTATPSLVATAPKLEPLSIQLTTSRGKQQVAANLADYEKQIRDLSKAQWQANNVRNTNYGNLQTGQQQIRQGGGMGGPGTGSGGIAAFQYDQAEQQDKNLNRIASQLQQLEITNGFTIKAKKKVKKSQPDEGIAVTYKLAGKTSLPSRSDQQLIQIASLPLDGEYYKLAVPVLTSYVYEEANVVNTSEMVMLAGPVATYVGGEFVGHGQVPTVAVGESFTVGFGIDSSLRATRELTDRTESIQGGNRVVNFEYRLAIENFGATPAKVRVTDRLPQAKNGQVKLTFASELEANLSKDENYQESDRKRGILRWDVEVPAQARGSKAFNVDYEFGLEYDKQMNITELAAKK